MDTNTSNENLGVRWLSPKQVANKLGIHRTHVYTLVREGKLMPPIKLGRLSMWEQGEIDSWMLEQGQNRRVV